MTGSPAVRQAWVGARVVRHAGPAVSRRPRPSLTDPIVRAGLLLDLALRGWIERTDDGLQLDTDHTGYPPADALVDAVAARPDRAMVWWLGAPAAGGYDTVARQLVADRVWTRHGHADTDPAGAAADLRRVQAADDSTDPATCAVAALLQLFPSAGPGGESEAARLAPRCGEASWLAVELVDHLAQRRRRFDAVSRDAAWTNVVGNFLP